MFERLHAGKAGVITVFRVCSQNINNALSNSKTDPGHPKFTYFLCVSHEIPVFLCLRLLWEGSKIRSLSQSLHSVRETLLIHYLTLYRYRKTRGL